MKVVFVIIGLIIGAGFASGKEIHLFFNSYGINGIIGILLSSILTGVIIYKVFKIICAKNISTYNEFVDILSSKIKVSKNINITLIVKIVISAFLLVSYYIMVAGFAAYLEQEFHAPFYVGSIILNLLSCIVFFNDTNGLVKANTFVIPIVVLIIIILGIKSLDFSIINNVVNLNINSNHSFYWIISTILYSSYNSILLLPALVTLRKYIKTTKDIIRISIITVLILVTLSLIISLILYKIDINPDIVEMPLVYIAGSMGEIYKYGYGVVILLSIFTTAISVGHGFLNNMVSQNKQNDKFNKLIIFMVISSLFVSKLGFSNLVNILYPMFGILGITQIIMIFQVSIEKEQ